MAQEKEKKAFSSRCRAAARARLRYTRGVAATKEALPYQCALRCYGARCAKSVYDMSRCVRAQRIERRAAQRRGAYVRTCCQRYAARCA